MGKKKTAAPAPAESAEPKYVYVLRTCNADMTSYGGFRWPESGPVEAPDWDASPRCGGGLHGFLNGEGDGALASWDADARWLVVRVAEDLVIPLDGKVKFPRGIVEFTGDRRAATAYISERVGVRAVIGGTATAGYGGTATAGYRGTATAGYRGTATAGDRGTATAGDGGTATAGDRGILVLTSWDGARRRVTVLYVGEDGINANVAYRIGNNGKPEEAK